LFFKPQDVDDLSAFLRTLKPDTQINFLGLGSNLLVRDGGIRGVVIATLGSFVALKQTSANEVWAGSGVTCAKLAKQCVKWGLGAAEFFAGIPGTVGGALAMNAGAFGGETWRHVLEVETIDTQGNVRRRPASDYQASYRHIAGPQNEWFLGARLHFEPRADVSDLEIRALLARRKATQPIGEWSCGSVFTNPPGDHAARLIEASGLKGFQIGGARVSEKHANFIINDGTASADDLERMIEHVRGTVARVQGVTLTPEVRIVGEKK
jgi:UDP-N-acetylmuramate dehydrogenase